MSPTLHVFLSGFGAPHVEEKLRILKSNRSIIESSVKWSSIHYTICCYDDTNFEELEKDSCITIIRSKGIVGQFLKRYLVPETTSTQYDYLLLLLDDVELQPNVSFAKMIDYLNYFQLDVLSPSMTRSSKHQFTYMLTDPSYDRPMLKITSVLEYFCYFTTPRWYASYYETIEPDQNPWMWGLDMILYRQFKYRIGILNHMTMRHWYKNESYGLHPTINPHDGFMYILTKYGETHETVSQQPSTFYYITDMENRG